MLLVLASLVTPANRPASIACPCGGAAIIEHEPGLCIIQCQQCKGSLCVVGSHARPERVKAMWDQRQRGFRDEQ